MDNKPSMLKAALIGGAAAGVLSSIPIVNILNCVCCAYLIGGGVLAAYMYSREVAAVGGSFTVGNGGLLGLLTGVFYAVIGSIVGFVVNMVLGVSVSENLAQVQEQLESQGNIPPESMEAIENILGFLDTSGTPVLILIGLGFSLLLGAVFCTIGGLIGGAVFKKEAAPTPGA